MESLLDSNGRLNDDVLNKVLDNTVNMIEQYKSQFIEIHKLIKLEIDSTQKQLNTLQSSTISAMNNIDALMKQEQAAKQNFAKVSGSPNVSEDELKSSYDGVKKVQTALEFEQQRWKTLGEQGDKTERRLKVLNSRLKQAEQLSMTIGTILHYLSTRIKGFVYSEYYIKPQEKSINAQIIRAQEDERHRISRELHDGAEHEVENIIAQTEAIENLIDTDLNAAKSSLHSLKNQLNECLNTIRQTMFNLRPLALEAQGLTSAIKQLVDRLSERGLLSVTYAVDGKEIALPQYIEAAVFRIVQESLNNVMQHSNVKSAQVRLRYAPSALSILVQDEGQGFDADENLQKQEAVNQKIDLHSTEYYKSREIANCYYGLLGMRERAKFIGAELNIISAVGKGTKVHLKVPFKNSDIANAVESDKISKAIARAEKRQSTKF